MDLSSKLLLTPNFFDYVKSIHIHPIFDSRDNKWNEIKKYLH